MVVAAQVASRGRMPRRARVVLEAVMMRKKIKLWGGPPPLMPVGNQACLNCNITQ